MKELTGERSPCDGCYEQPEQVLPDRTEHCFHQVVPHICLRVIVGLLQGNSP